MLLYTTAHIGTNMSLILTQRDAYREEGLELANR